jgi:hypothetical protein
MWNLLAKWKNPKTRTLDDVTIIAHYYDTETKTPIFIAVTMAGEFICGYMDEFTSQNTVGFISKDRL